MTKPDDIKFMRRCLELAVKAEGMTFPNPMVGSVIVHNGTIIGEGYHLQAGKPHAEVNAISGISDRSLLSESTLYVNLEPCSHYGKTGPCSDLIISYNIPRIVIGTIDTSGKVSGHGLNQLKTAGCEVITSVLEKECRRLNRRFFTFHEKSRPYVTLKWAQSSDGYIDIKRPKNFRIEPYWITGKPERVLVHKWRSAEQAVLVGAGTIRADNPRLNVRQWKGNDPVRIILSGSGMLGVEPAISKTGGSTILFTRNADADLKMAVKKILNDEKTAGKQIVEYLYTSGIQSLLIEGGAELLNHFITMGLWDEARIFHGNSFFKNGVKAPVLKGKLLSRFYFSSSKLDVILNTQ